MGSLELWLIIKQNRLNIKQLKKQICKIGLFQFGKHKGVICGKDWIQVQNLLKNNENKRYRKPIKNDALLSRILRCSKCGSYMRPKIHTGRIYEETGKIRFSYMCELKEKVDLINVIVKI